MPIQELIDTMYYKTISHTDFCLKFTLVENHFKSTVGNTEYLFEPDGKELEYINFLKNSNRVWTIWEEDGLIIYTSTVSDYNPYGFLITNEPYTENIRVMLIN
jgi:hypothetical protein